MLTKRIAASPQGKSIALSVSRQERFEILIFMLWQEKRLNVVFKGPQEQNVKHDLLTSDQPKPCQSKLNVELIQKD